MGIKSRRKGARVERAIARLLQDAGFAAEKVSRAWSGGADLSVPLLGRDLRGEVKARAQFKWLHDSLNKDGADFLVLQADRRERLYVVRERLAIEIASKAEGRK